MKRVSMSVLMIVTISVPMGRAAEPLSDAAASAYLDAWAAAEPALTDHLYRDVAIRAAVKAFGKGSRSDRPFDSQFDYAAARDRFVRCGHALKGQAVSEDETGLYVLGTPDGLARFDRKADGSSQLQHLERIPPEYRDSLNNLRPYEIEGNTIEVGLGLGLLDPERKATVRSTIRQFAKPDQIAIERTTLNGFDCHLVTVRHPPSDQGAGGTTRHWIADGSFACLQIESVWSPTSARLWRLEADGANGLATFRPKRAILQYYSPKTPNKIAMSSEVRIDRFEKGTPDPKRFDLATYGIGAGLPSSPSSTFWTARTIWFSIAGLVVGMGLVTTQARWRSTRRFSDATRMA